MTRLKYAIFRWIVYQNDIFIYNPYYFINGLNSLNETLFIVVGYFNINVVINVQQLLEHSFLVGFYQHKRGHVLLVEEASGVSCIISGTYSLRQFCLESYLLPIHSPYFNHLI
jgi:hypothetical protein